MSVLNDSGKKTFKQFKIINLGLLQIFAFELFTKYLPIRFPLSAKFVEFIDLFQICVHEVFRMILNISQLKYIAIGIRFILVYEVSLDSIIEFGTRDLANAYNFSIKSVNLASLPNYGCFSCKMLGL